MLKTKTDVKYLFNKFFNGEPNFITPTQEDFGIISAGKEKYIYEISSGSGMFGGSTIGITVLKVDSNEEVERTELSHAVHEKSYQTAMKGAKEYIKSLRTTLRTKEGGE